MRKRYPDNHWATDTNPVSALQKYTSLYANHFNHTKLSLFLSLLPKNLTGKKVLDVGGGAGMLSVCCAKRGAQVTLIDAERSALQTAGLFANQEGVFDKVTHICSQSIPAAVMDGSFDIIIAKDIIEHIDDDHAYIRKLACCQKKDGELLLSTQNSFSINYFLEVTYNKYWLGNKDWCGWDSTHLRFYNPLSINRLLRHGGYAIHKWQGIYIVPYDILSWATLLKKKIELPSLRWVDLIAGGVFPLNIMGWDLIISASLKHIRA